jgi:RNA polymerase sigma-70 factor (ECF subfamily)
MSDLRNRIIPLLPRLRAFAHSLARSADVADDLLQATCEKALKAADQWQPGTRLDSWMYRIMQNHWIDMKRRERPQAPVETLETDIGHSEDGRRVADGRLLLSDVQTLIDRLPEDQRSVLVLVCVDDMSYRETAEILGIPIGTVMSRLSRARATLAAALEGGAARKARAAGDQS